MNISVSKGIVEITDEECTAHYSTLYEQSFFVSPLFLLETLLVILEIASATILVWLVNLLPLEYF